MRVWIAAACYLACGEDTAMQCIYRWQPVDGPGLEHLILRQGDNMIVADGVVVGSDDDDGPFGCSYRICCNADWLVRSVEANVAGGGLIVLTTDGDGHWRDGDGHALPQLDGCIDVDISATPFTNTLPIRRLSTQLAQRAELCIAWIRIPALEVHRAPQAYTWLHDGRYRFEALATGFEAVLEVDANGLVLDYPALFRRVET